MPISELAKNRYFPSLDVMAIAPVVNDVANDFERYWSCSSVSILQKVLSLSEQELTQRIELPDYWYKMRSPAAICISWKPVNLWRIWIVAKTRLLSDTPSKSERRCIAISFFRSDYLM